MDSSEMTWGGSSLLGAARQRGWLDTARLVTSDGTESGRREGDRQVD